MRLRLRALGQFTRKAALMPGKRWTSREVERLRREWEKHGRSEEVKLRGRSADSIRRKLVREGLIDPDEGKRSTWGREEEEKLRQLVGEGLTARQIHEGAMPERSYHSIAQKISRMKLLEGEGRSQQLRDCRRLDGQEMEEFHKAIQDYGTSRHTAWFVWKFAVGRGKVKRALKSAGRAVSWREAMRLPQTRQRFASRVSEASAEAWERRRSEMKGAMVKRLREMEGQLEKDPSLAGLARYGRRRCAVCGGNWFADSAFYKTSYKRLPAGGRRRYLQRSCRVCTSGQRGASTKRRVEEGQQRENWRARLAQFGENLIHTHPELYRDPELGLAVRWEPFVEVLESKSSAEVMALVESVVRIYAEEGVSEVLDRLEERCFGGEPELHADIWNLDERLRAPARERPGLVREGGLSPAGRRLAIRLYRVIRLPEYAATLI